MAMNMSMREREYCFDHGWRIDSEGIIHMSREQYSRCSGTGKSTRYPDTRTLTLPTDFGIALIFEGKHFVIDGWEG